MKNRNQVEILYGEHKGRIVNLVAVDAHGQTVTVEVPYKGEIILDVGSIIFASDNKIFEE